MSLKGSKTEGNLKDAFAGESQANRRYLYFAAKTDVEGYNDVAAVFRRPPNDAVSGAGDHALVEQTVRNDSQRRTPRGCTARRCEPFRRYPGTDTTSLKSLRGGVFKSRHVARDAFAPWSEFAPCLESTVKMSATSISTLRWSSIETSTWLARIS